MSPFSKIESYLNYDCNISFYDVRETDLMRVAEDEFYRDY